MRRSNALKIVAAAMVLFGALGHAGIARAEDVPSGDFVIPAGATLYKGGRSCVSVVLPMASFVYDGLVWDLDAHPRSAEIRFGGRWNLDACRVRRD